MDDNEARWVEEDDGSYYYYYSDGTMATGWMQCGDYWYYFDESGKMATGWRNIDGDTYYFYSTGEMATGWIDSGNGWYYLYDNGSMAWGRTVNGYLLDKNGKMVTGTGWVYEDGDNWSYLYDNGTMAWGRTVDGYYLNDNGDWVKDKGWKTEKDNNGNVTYYYVDSEIAVTGWKEIDSKWYYFDEDGKMKTGWIEDNGNWYYLNSSGAMETGQNDIDGNTYYFYSTGEMATGWVQYGDNWHYFYKDDNGSMAHDTMIGQYYVNANGDWEPSEDNNTPENIDSSNSHETSDGDLADEVSNTEGDNSWKQECLERGWGPLTKEAYDEKVAEAKSQGTYFQIVHANEFDWRNVVWGSVTGVDTVTSEGTIIVSSVSKYMAKYVYNNSVLTNSSSRKEAYKKMFDIANRADDIRMVSRTIDSGGWKSLSTKIGVGGTVIAGGINIFNDLNNTNYDNEGKKKAVVVDISTTLVSTGTAIAIAAFIPGVGWAFAVGIAANIAISAAGEFWKESWIE
ncbi:cell wall binding repeat-containing protein [Clostridium sp. DL-VIII]|uniref:N-acetylmuramoyl-L-alanine amidase family protein n=1 Tax=Clostridium sp. DL-VIII TaxID=641107 RepID=UPI00023AF6A0|nr:N-acetylmuramoyl-L-alanine amidase family protein [Clostridium sp. DL-VIII]EHI97934.1 cell wall binding repeat-containing protein [Clostridium sp. DL-VIII]